MIKCKNCGYPVIRFSSLSFGRKQCKCCGTIYTAAQIKK